MSAQGYLFSDGELREWLQARENECRSDMLTIPESELLAKPPDELGEIVLARFRLEPLTLHQDRMGVEDRGEHQVWGPGGLRTARVQVNSGAGIPGHEVLVRVPYSGTPQLWLLKPSTWTANPPQARVEHGVLLFPFQYPAGARPAIKQQMEDFLNRIKEPWLRAVNEDAERFNGAVTELVNTELRGRRDRILENREHLEGLGLPVYRRDNAPTTYASAAIERRPTPQAAVSAGREAARTEPTLVDDLYEHIIEVITAMAHAMERAPGGYPTWTEEQLRDSLLMMVNTHYRGQATGETFNKSGKTDILVRDGDRNVFVAECKWWEGSTAFAGVDREPPSALDQLRKYGTWRDAKLALAVFVPNKGISGAIESARGALEGHPAFLAWSSSAADEGVLRCRIRMEDDDRAADLAVVFVHLPRA